MVHVMALHSGRVHVCPSSALRFADGSALEPSPLESGARLVAVPNGKVVTLSKGSASQLKSGDSVKLRSSANLDLRGCLGEPGWQWVGKVRSVDEISAIVECNQNAQRRHPALNYPNYQYPVSFLMLAHEVEEGGVQALRTGERVQLADDFKENAGDG